MFVTILFSLDNNLCTSYKLLIALIVHPHNLEDRDNKTHFQGKFNLLILFFLNCIILLMFFVWSEFIWSE